MRPQLHVYKDIDSSRSFKQFSLKNYKSLAKLKITKQSTQNRKLKLHSLSIKNLRHLDLSCFDIKNLTTPQLKLLLKRSYKIQQFSAPNQDILSAFLILKNAQYLNNLSLKTFFNHIPQRFLSVLHISKLKTLKLTQMIPSHERSGTLQVNISKYIPSTTENLSLLWPERVPIITKLQHPFSLKHLSNLQKLEFGMPFALNTFKDIIKTIRNPSKLTTLRFNVQNEDRKDRGDDIERFLKRCVNLEELNFQSSMIDFYPQIMEMELKKLVIQQSIDTDDELLILGDLIQQQRNSLQNLSLKLLVSSRRSLGHGYWFKSLFEKIKLLKRLKRFELRMIPYVYYGSLSISASLVRAIEALENLEEIDLEEAFADFKNESLENLCRALTKRHSKTLQSLKLSLNGCSCSGNILKALQRLPRLEHLALRKFLIEKETNFFIELRDIVCFKNQGLNSVIMRDAQRQSSQGDRENFEKMLKGIIWKPTMRHFDYREMFRLYNQAGFERGQTLKTDGILKEVDHFEYLGICSFLEFDSLKWRDLKMAEI